MVPLFSSLHAHTPILFATPNSSFCTRLPRFKNPTHRPHYFPVNSTSRSPFQFTSQIQNTQNPRNPQSKTLYPSGYKRPEIKVPNLVLQLDPSEVLGGGDALDLVDKALSKWAGIVVLNGGEGSGGKVYEAACKLKSLVRDRAYLMVAERVDIAAAVNASGVLLSDQGLPAIVARNTMLDSKSESMFLPLVARNVKTMDAAIHASSSEGADFLLYDISGEEPLDMITNSVFKNVKIPIFITFASDGDKTTLNEVSKLLTSGASGLVLSLKGLRSFGDDVLSKIYDSAYMSNKSTKDDVENLLELVSLDMGIDGTSGMAGFVKLEDREKRLIESEKAVLLEAVTVIKRAAPLMGEVSLLIDAVSRLDEPFLLAILGEFNSGKSTVINALLGRRYLKEGVVPTTNEITFLCYSELDPVEQQHCARFPDGQYVCYLPAPILKEMSIVDTPGTNVILQRQQRLTEEFVPRADLLLFVISADRPFTESEVAFLRYTQQWKKKVVFVLNKADLYQNANELEEAMSFIKQNAEKLLNTENVKIYPVSARCALNAKLSALSNGGKDYGVASFSGSHSFDELEEFLYSFLDGSTSTGMERMKLKLQTPIGIAERLFSACETLVRQDCHRAKQDVASVNELIDSVRNYAMKMESESIPWRRRTLSLIDTTKSRVVKLIESTLQLSNIDLVASYVLKGEKTAPMSATSKIQSDIIVPALSDAQKLLQDYVVWLQSTNAREGILYKESFEKQWPATVSANTQVHFETYELLKKVDELSLKAVENFSGTAASQLFEQKIREVILGTFGGLGAAGLSASLLTSVLPTTMEDLLALGLCSAGGYLAILNFPNRRKELIDKVKRTADALACEVEEAMEEDMLEAIRNLEKFVNVISKPYQDEAQQRLDKLLEIQDELSTVQNNLQSLQIGIQNLHVS